MRAERSRGRRGLLSQPLLAAIRLHLRSGGRVALFVNRVGYARILFCQECGRAVRCKRCEVAMPYDGERRAIFCRICGRTDPAPEVCPGCGGAALRWIGAGTERVEEVIGRLFPEIRIARVDRETEREFAKIAADFAGGRTRIVVGTQLMLRARELRPTLIGVVDADLPLYLPDFRAGERTLQQLRAVLSLPCAGDRRRRGPRGGPRGAGGRRPRAARPADGGDEPAGDPVGPRWRSSPWTAPRPGFCAGGRSPSGSSHPTSGR